MGCFRRPPSPLAREQKRDIAGARLLESGLMSHNPYSDPLDAAFSDEPVAAPVPRDPPYLAGLNKEQREAVETVDGPCWCWPARAPARRGF